MSPSTEALDRTRKVSAYAREGVAHAWIVNPQARTLEVYRLSDGRWALLATHEGQALVRGEPVEAIALELAELWAVK